MLRRPGDAHVEQQKKKTSSRLVCRPALPPFSLNRVTTSTRAVSAPTLLLYFITAKDKTETFHRLNFTSNPQTSDYTAKGGIVIFHRSKSTFWNRSFDFIVYQVKHLFNHRLASQPCVYLHSAMFTLSAKQKM